MRVTKVIREYIEKRVSDVYDPKIDSIGKEYYKEKEKIENEVQEIVNRANDEINRLLAENGYSMTFGRKQMLETKNIDNNDIIDEIRRKKSELKKEKTEKITDIIVTLELGGTKAELEEMLKNL